jgi:hypothetical protein
MSQAESDYSTAAPGHRNERAALPPAVTAADADSPPPAKPKPAKKRSRRPPLKRRPGLYYPTNVTLEDFFKAYGQLPTVKSPSSPSGKTSSADDVFKPSYVDEGLPAELRSALAKLAELRAEAAAEVDRLLAFLDATELDADLEAQGDELDSGPEDDAEDGADDEPSLGSIERHPSEYSAGPDNGVVNGAGHERGWSDGGLDDREDEHDGSEPDVDDEPSLGSFEAMANQADAWRADNPWNIVDGEDDPADSGIADPGGLAEQIGRAI